jgi:hypothetical protein
MSLTDNVFRIAFRLRGKDYQLICVDSSARQARDALAALSPRLEVLGVEDLGLRSEMDDNEFERLRSEDLEQNE